MFEKMRSYVNLTIDSFTHRAALSMTGVRIPSIWKRNYKADAYHVSSVELKFRGELPGAIGFGASVDRGIAALKAVMEAIESIALAQSKIHHQSRSGTAAHFSAPEAKEKAYLELIERDAFLFHWLTEEPGLMLSEKEHKAIVEVTKTSGLKGLVITKLASIDLDVQVVLATFENLSSACICVGLGSSKSFRDAIEQAVREVQVYRSAHPLNGLCPSDSIRAKSSSSDPQAKHRLLFADHHIGTRDAKIAALLRHISSSGSSLHRTIPSGLKKRMVFVRLPSISQKVHVIHASSPDLLPIFFGNEFRTHESQYRELLSQAKAPVRLFRFHDPKRFLPHPID